MRGGKRRRFVHKDWVYTSGGYLNSVFSQNSGIANAIAQPLSFASGAERFAAFGNEAALPGLADYERGPAKPDPQPQVVYAVEGHVVYNPSAWALGNEFIWGWRLMIYPQDAITAGIEVDADYSMWQNAAPPSPEFSYFRNSSRVLAEGRWYKAFGDNTSNGMWRAEIRWKSRQGRRILEDEGLFLYLEGASASVNSTRNRIYCRALMKAI